MTKKRVMLGMSGGVDSSAAALLLQKDGYEVVGATLLLTAAADESAAADAREVCNSLGIEHKIYDLKAAFNQYVVNYFTAEYMRGRTPNPCIECNKFIKFGKMFELAQSEGCDFIATGHYARTAIVDGEYALLRSKSNKDQSYALWQIARDSLSKIIFPVANMEKQELRELVKKAGLNIYSKPDSQDICFIPNGDYAEFIKRRFAEVEREGLFTDSEGKVLGKHRGVLHYTIGQRKGLGGGFKEPMFVVKIIPEENRIILGAEGSQYSKSLSCTKLNLLTDLESGKEHRVMVKTRYSARAAAGSLIVDCETATAKIEFDEKQRAVTPGQSAVFYTGERVLGGGVIEATE